MLEDASPRVQQVLAGLRGSTYMEPRWAGSMPQAEQWLRRHEVEAILRVPSDFSGRLQTGDATVQLVVNGSESTSAATIESYVNGVLALWAQKEADRAGPAGQTLAAGSVQVQQRLWFNEAGESTWFLVPGLLVLVLTLIGAFLTSLVAGGLGHPRGAPGGSGGGCLPDGDIGSAALSVTDGPSPRP